MAPQEPQLTAKELRELFVTAKQNQKNLADLNIRIKDIHRVVIGNGEYRDSLVGRLQLVEERQKVGAAKQDEICGDLEKMQETLDSHTALLEKDHLRIKDLTDANVAAQSKLDKLEATVAAWRNKAIGIGIGVGLGTGTGLYFLSELIAKFTEGVTP
jgi:chromosome segregation ATPase